MEDRRGDIRLIAGSDKILSIIPARGGSKGIPKKNIRPLLGKPLIAWSIEAANRSQYISDCICSTDDIEIAKIAKQYGCDVPYIRQSDLAMDTTPMIDVVLDVLKNIVGYDWIVLLQPTSPLRTHQDIDSAIKLCVEKNALSCASISIVKKSPNWMFRLEESNRIRPLLDDSLILRRQDIQPVYQLNGAIYIANVNWLRKYKKLVCSQETIGYVMDECSSIDIDEEIDFVVCEDALSRV